MITFILSLCVMVMILGVALPLNIYTDAKKGVKVDEWSSDISVTLRSSSDVRLVYEDEIAEAVGDKGRVLGEFMLSGYLKLDDGTREETNFGAFDLVAADQFFEIRYVDYGKITNNNLDRTVIINEIMAEHYGYGIGDTVKVNVLGQTFDFVVQGIAKKTGIFWKADMLVDISSIRSALNEKSPFIASLPSDFEPYTKVHIKLNDGYDKIAVRDELQSLPNFSDKLVSESNDSIKGDYSVTIMILTAVMPSILLVIVAAMMMVSAFNLLQKKRRGDMALFKIVGADSGHLSRIMYLEGVLYSLVGGIIGSIASIPGIKFFNTIYNFKYSRMTFGLDEILIGMGSAQLFTGLCTFIHLRKQKKNSLSEELAGGNLDTDRRFSFKKLLFLIPSAIILCVILALPPKDRYMPAFLLLAVSVVFMYVIAPYVISGFAAAMSFLLSKKRKGAGKFILAAKSCANSYPLRHAGRMMTVLFTVFMSLVFVLNAVESQLTQFMDMATFDYTAYEVDGETKDRIRELDGVIGTAEVNIGRNVYLTENVKTNGMAISGDLEACFDEVLLPDQMPVGDTIILSSGVAQMCGFKIGDKVKCTISDIDCELTLIDTIDTYGDFAYYDADYLGVSLRMFCVLTDGTDAAHENLLSLFNERGVEYMSRYDAFAGTYENVQPQLIIFKVMFITMVLMTLVGVINILSEQRMERGRELEIIMLNGATKRDNVLMQVVEIAYIFICAFLASALFSYLLCRIINFAAISFGLTLYV